MLQQLVHTTLLGALASTGVEDRVFQHGTLGVGSNPKRPDFQFVLHRSFESAPYNAVRETSRAADHVYQIFSYDEAGSNTRNKEVLIVVRDALLELPGQVSPGGVRCIGAVWNGFSQDFGNEEYLASVKYATITLTANE